MPEFDGVGIVETLRFHDVKFVVIGGFAAAAQGSPLPTTDVDVVPSTDRHNFARLSDALTELEARVRRAGNEPQPFAHDTATLLAADKWELTTKYGDLDILPRPAGTQGYADLRRDALTITLRGVDVQVASLADIVRSKEAAGRDKDRRALPVLRELVARQLRERR